MLSNASCIGASLPLLKDNLSRIPLSQLVPENYHDKDILKYDKGPEPTLKPIHYIKRYIIARD